MKPVAQTLAVLLALISWNVSWPGSGNAKDSYPPLAKKHIETIKEIAHDLKMKGDFSSIRKLMDLAIEFDPGDWELYKFRGRALKLEGRYAESIADFKTLLSLKAYDYAHLSIVETLLFWDANDLGEPDPVLHKQRVQEALTWIRRHEPVIEFPDVVTFFHLFDLVGKSFAGSVTEADFTGYQEWLKAHPLSARGKKWGFEETLQKIHKSGINPANKERLLELVRLTQTSG